MSKDDVWYYGSVYTRKPCAAIVVKRTPNFVTLSNGTRAKIDGNVLVYRPSRTKWFEWLRGTMRSRFDAAKRELERAERDLKEAQELLDEERELDREYFEERHRKVLRDATTSETERNGRNK